MITYFLCITGNHHRVRGRLDSNTPIIGLFMATGRLNHTVSKIFVNSIIQISPSPKYGQ